MEFWDQKPIYIKEGTFDVNNNMRQDLTIYPNPEFVGQIYKFHYT